MCEVQDFQYEPFEPSGSSIRLLRLKAGHGKHIHCDLIPSSLNDDDISNDGVSTQYEAVSYTWGTDLNHDVVWIDGRKLGITLNLSRILRDLRQPDKDRILWIDAICINQQDLEERSTQVQRMGDIYRQARRVLFCVCRPEEDVDWLFEVLNDIEDHVRAAGIDITTHSIDNEWVTLEKSLDEQHFLFRYRLEKAFEFVFQQSWFYRIWIVQEIVNAREARIYCGQRSISSAIFAEIASISDLQLSTHIRNILTMMPSPRRKVTRSVRDLHTLICDLKDAKASDPHDKIFAILDLCSDSEAKIALKPDYTKSESALVYDVIKYLCNCSIIEERDRYGCRGSWTIDEFMQEAWDIHQRTFISLTYPGNCYTDIEKEVASLILHHGDKLTFDSRMVSYAARCSGPEVSEAMLKLNDFDKKALNDDIYDTKLMLSACYHAQEALVSRWLDLGVDPNEGIRTNYPRNWLQVPLSSAIRAGRERLVRMLLDRGAEVIRPQDKFFESPLMAAVDGSWPEMVELLLDRGADPGSCDGWGVSALHLATYKGSVKIMRSLLERGADVHALATPPSPPQYRAERHVIHVAAELDTHEPLELVLSWGAISDATTHDGPWDPLMSAMHGGCLANIRLLLPHVPITPMAKLYAVWIASSTDEKGSALDLLLERGADMSVVDPVLPSALSMAAIVPRSLSIISKILKAGVDVTDTEGSFTLYLADNYGFDETKKVLLDHGAQYPNDPNDSYWIDKEWALRGVAGYWFDKSREWVGTYPGLFFDSLYNGRKSLDEIIAEQVKTHWIEEHCNYYTKLFKAIQRREKAPDSVSDEPETYEELMREHPWRCQNINVA